MSVRKRANGVYHYRFKVRGELFTGTTGCTNKKEAEKVEADRKRELQVTRSEAAAWTKARRAMSQSELVALDEAWDRFMALPGRNRKSPRMPSYASHWADFTAFMAWKYPSVRHLDTVMPVHAEAYASYTELNGRFSKRTSASKAELSGATLNDIRRTCRRVFAELSRGLNLPANPFRDIPCIKANTVEREPFSEEELQLIGRSADKSSWIYHLFLVGYATGLREGDVCTLKWDEVDFERGVIERRQRKTGRVAVIPMSIPGLRDHLLAIERSGEYVHPDLAERYTDEARRSNIGKDVCSFLEGIGIETTRKVDGRSRLAKIKDVHSLRHTFAVLSALNGIPMKVVQEILGHMTPKMTEMYSRHESGASMKVSMYGAVPNLLLEKTEKDNEISGDPIEIIRGMNASNWKASRDRLLSMMAEKHERRIALST